MVAGVATDLDIGTGADDRPLVTATGMSFAAADHITETNFRHRHSITFLMGIGRLMRVALHKSRNQLYNNTEVQEKTGGDHVSGREEAIGIFDSGVGGIGTLKTMREILPHEHFLYYGDTANAPYGTKSPEAVMGCIRNVLCFHHERLRI